MKSYRVVEFGQPLQAFADPDPRPRGSEVVLRVTAAGVCHSDLHIWEGGYDLGEGRRLGLRERGVALPLTMGHEVAGEIVALGPHASDRRVGESCLVFPWIGCGECAVCRAGEENLCMQPRCLGIHRDGGYADHILVPHPRYLLPLDGLDPVATAPFACSGLTTYSAIRKLGPVIADEAVLIVGAGGLGLMALGILKAMGGRGAISVDIDPKKREAARAAGALAAIDGAALDAADQIRGVAGGPVRAAIDLVGSPATARLAFDCLVKGGRLVMVGLFGGSTPWSLPMLPLKAATIQGCYTGSLGELRDLLALVRKGGVPELPIQRRALDQANQSLDDLRHGRLVGRAVMTA